MKTIDLRKTMKPLYTASASRPAFIEVPRVQCLMEDGMGDPSSTGFQEAVGSLYSVAYTLKFLFKKERSIDYPVMPLEGLWSADDIGDFLKGRRDAWKWTLFIVVPDVVGKADVSQAVSDVKKKAKFPRFPEIRFESFAEGKAAQIMHIGAYAAERATIECLHQFVQDNGCRLRGRHHEIYMGDPRRASPDKLKTIVRHPVEPAAR